MIKLLFILISLSIYLFAIDIDPKVLQDIINKDPHANKEKLLLAKYYDTNNNELKALNLVNSVLQEKPKNKNAILLKQQIEKKQKNKDIYREASLKLPVSKEEAQKRLDTYYSDNNYQFYSTLYEALVNDHIKLDDDYHTKAGYIYLWDARYKHSKLAINRVKGKNNIDVAKIQADICYYKGDYKCSVKLFEKLYRTSYKLDYALKLINSYMYLGDTTKAKRLYSYLHRKYPTNNELTKIGNKLQASEKNYLNNKKEAYEKNKTLETLKSYTIALNELGKTSEAIEVVHNYNSTENATGKSLLLESQYLLWSDKTKEALDILKKANLKDDLKAKLMLGQIYSWDHKFDKSKEYLDEVIKTANDKQLLYDAKKARAFVDMWQKDYKNAKKSFSKLQKENPNDNEVKEALMEINHNYKGLLPIYIKKEKNTKDPQDIKRLAELYLNAKNYKQAIPLLKKYLQKNPQDLDANKQLALLLIDKKEYYQGFGYLEYYAAQKQTLESSLILAKNYYWNGFSKEALDVLDRTIKKYPDSKEALQLKAKILKISPRFTTSNSGATIGTYFNKVASTQLQLADSLYFNNHYKASLMYYESYLSKHPDDHEARLRYAYALESAKEYGKAEGEFSLVLWTKNSDELRYHYAYNMMKNNKLNEAEKLLLKLKKNSFHKIDTNLNNFVESWKEAWQSQKFSKYSSFYSDSFKNNQTWAFSKQQTFENAKYISVAIYEPLSKQIDLNHYIVRFYQEYATDTKSDKGYKMLYITCDKNKTKCKITKELWRASEYKKALILSPFIENSLKEIKRLREVPLASLGKKKSTLV